MSTKNYASKVKEWLAAEQDKRVETMREALLEKGESGDERFDANTVSNMSIKELRDAVNEFIDAPSIAEKIEKIIDAMGGDTEAAMKEVEVLAVDISGLPTGGYSRFVRLSFTDPGYRERCRRSPFGNDRLIVRTTRHRR